MDQCLPWQARLESVQDHRWDLLSARHRYVDDQFADSWSQWLQIFAIGVVPLVGHQLTEPTQHCVGREQGSLL